LNDLFPRFSNTTPFSLIRLGNAHILGPRRRISPFGGAEPTETRPALRLHARMGGFGGFRRLPGGSSTGSGRSGSSTGGSFGGGGG